MKDHIGIIIPIIAINLKYLLKEDKRLGYSFGVLVGMITIIIMLGI